MDTFANVMLGQRNLISDYFLLTEDISYETLVGTLKEFELKHGPLHKHVYDKHLHMLPTQQLLNCIRTICEHFNVKQVIKLHDNNVFDPLINNIMSMCTHDSDHNNNNGDNNNGVCNSNTNKLLYIVWQISDIRWTCVTTITSCQPTCCCYLFGTRFGSTYLSNDQKWLPVSTGAPAKMLSSLDYFKDDNIRKNRPYTYSRTCITVFTDKSSTANFRKLYCGTDLHYYEEHDEDYHVQDGKVFYGDKNKRYIGNNINQLDSEDINSLLNMRINIIPTPYSTQISNVVTY